MSTVTLEEAQVHLSELVEQLIPGEELAITREWMKLQTEKNQG